MNRLFRHAAFALVMGLAATQAGAEISASTKSSPMGQIDLQLGDLLGHEREGLQRLPDGA